MREAAAVTQCTNNLKQIALGLHGYHDSHRHFPVGTVETTGMVAEKRLSWLVSILPYVEQQALGRQLDPKLPWDAEENRKPVSAVIPIYLCPAYPGMEPGLNHTHYVGLAGLGADAPLLEKDHRDAGFFGYTRRITSLEIKDGTSLTIAVMETTAHNGPWAAGGPATLRSLLFDEVPYIAEYGPFGMKHKTDTFFRTNRVTALSAFADGTVRGISADVTPNTLRALVTIAGRDEIGPDF